MAITVSVSEVANAIRVGNTAEETAEVTRLLAYASEAIQRHLGNAFDSTPDTVVNEAVIRLTGGMYDTPSAARGDGFSNVMRSSGAARMLLPYRIHTAGSTTSAVAQARAVGSVGNPVTDVRVQDGVLIVSFADGTTDTHALPAGDGMGDGTDAEARAAAATAQGTADGAQQAAGENTTAIAILPVPFDWAREGNADPVPDAKISSAIRGHRLFIDTNAPTDGILGDVWIRDTYALPLAIFEHTGTGWSLDYTFRGGRIHLTTAAHNIAMDTPLSVPGDLLLELVAGTLKIYRRLLAGGAPYWTYIGAVSGGGGGTPTSTFPTYTSLVTTTVPSTGSFWRVLAANGGSTLRTAWNSGDYHSILFDSRWTIGNYDYQSSLTVPIRQQAANGRGVRIVRPVAENDNDIERARIGLEASGDLVFEPTSAFHEGATITVYGVA